MIPPAQQEAKHIEGVAGKISFKKFARQSHTARQVGREPADNDPSPRMTMHSVLQKENTQKWSPFK